MKSYNIHTHLSENENECSIRNISQQEFNQIDSYNNSFFSIGYHPWYECNIEDIEINLKVHLVHEKCLAIGECGLDKNINSSIDIQIQIFEKQIALSELHQKPLIIHCVKAHQEIIALKKKHQPKQAWILHGFNKNKQLATQCMKENILLSFSSIAHLQNVFEDASSFLESIFFLENDIKQFSVYTLYQEISDTYQIHPDLLHRKFEDSFKYIFKI